MNIREMFVGYTGLVDVGSLAYFIVVRNAGMEITVKELVEKASHFNTVVLTGSPFKQNDEVAKFIKALTDKNQNVKVLIYDDGGIAPVGMGGLKNVTYIISLKLKQSNIPYEVRIIPKSIEWFVKMKALFIFDIYTNDDIDESDLLIQEFSINKALVYFSPISHHHMDKLLRKSKRLGYNFAP